MESAESSSELVKTIKEYKYFIIGFVCLLVAVTLLFIYYTQINKGLNSVKLGDSQVNPSLTQSSMGVQGPTGPAGPAGLAGPDGNPGQDGPG
jgi:hypothetical protein